jgi:HK97 family phage major capsid protein
MERLTELRAELATLLSRTKAMLAEFPGPSWGTTHQAEWNAHMQRFNELNGEIKILEDQAGAVSESSPVPRGIQSVHAQVDDIPAVIAGLNTAFNDFKSKHNDRLTQLEAAVDTANTRAAAQELNGPVSVVAPTLGPKAMRTYADFRAHYTAKEGDSAERVSVTDFVRGVAGMKSTAAVQAALSMGTGSTGGYSVPAQTMPQILSAMTPVSSLLLAGAGFVPMEEGASSVTTAVVETVPTASWRLERGDVAESDPSFRAVVAKPQSLAFYFRISRELLADGRGIEAALNTTIAQAFAKALDYAGLRGSGVLPEPMGIKNTPGVRTIANGTNGAALGGYANFMAVAEATLTANAPMPTAAIMAPRSLIKLAGLTDSTGQPLRKPELLANLPMIATPQIPINLATGTSSDTSEIYLGDFTQMYFLMRETLSIQILKETFAKTGELAFLCHVRADVVIPRPAAFSVITGVRA